MSCEFSVSSGIFISPKAPLWFSIWCQDVLYNYGCDTGLSSWPLTFMFYLFLVAVLGILARLQLICVFHGDPKTPPDVGSAPRHSASESLSV